MDAHLCELQRDLRRVVIAENSEDTMFRTDGVEDQFHPRVDLVAGTEDFEAVIARHDADIHGQSIYDLSGPLGQSVNPIDVEIRQMQNTKTVERGGQGAELEAERADYRLAGG